MLVETVQRVYKVYQEVFVQGCVHDKVQFIVVYEEIGVYLLHVVSGSELVELLSLSLFLLDAGGGHIQSYFETGKFCHHVHGLRLLWALRMVLHLVLARKLWKEFDCRWVHFGKRLLVKIEGQSPAMNAVMKPSLPFLEVIIFLNVEFYGLFNQSKQLDIAWDVSYQDYFILLEHKTIYQFNL